MTTNNRVYPFEHEYESEDSKIRTMMSLGGEEIRLFVNDIYDHDRSHTVEQNLSAQQARELAKSLLALADWMDAK